MPEDYSQAYNWGSGSTVSEPHTADADFSPVFEIAHGNGWGADTAAIPFVGFPAGSFSHYETLNFKIKSLPTGSVFVKFASGGGPELEVEFSLATFATAIPGTTGWFQVSLPMSSFPNPDDYTEFGIHGGWSNGGTFLLTDIMFQ